MFIQHMLSPEMLQQHIIHTRSAPLHPDYKIHYKTEDNESTNCDTLSEFYTAEKATAAAPQACLKGPHNVSDWRMRDIFLSGCLSVFVEYV